MQAVRLSGRCVQAKAYIELGYLENWHYVITTAIQATTEREAFRIKARRKPAPSVRHLAPTYPTESTNDNAASGMPSNNPQKPAMGFSLAMTSGGNQPPE